MLHTDIKGEQRHSSGFRLDQDPLRWQLSDCDQQGEEILNQADF